MREQDNLIKGLHDQIRRYCIDNHLLWSKKYGELARGGRERIGNGYTKEALDIFPRYVLLEKVLIEIERYVPEDFSTLDEAKHIFRSIVVDARNGSLKANENEIESRAICDELSAVYKLIDDTSEKELLLVEPLFYRRVLSEKESDLIWQNPSSRWGISDQYWYPLSMDRPDNTEAFQDSHFEKEVGPVTIRNILVSHGINNIYEFREFGANYHLELSVFEPYYNGAEGYWCDETYSWVFYASHESSITVSGWVLQEIQAAWPNWKDRVWTTPFFE